MTGSANTRLRATALLLAAAVVISLSLICGSTFATPTQVVHALAGSGDPLTRAVILELRLPRLLNALGVGSLLALTGVALQALFRNPLADPYILGVSGGGGRRRLVHAGAGLGAGPSGRHHARAADRRGGGQCLRRPGDPGADQHR